MRLDCIIYIIFLNIFGINQFSYIVNIFKKGVGLKRLLIVANVSKEQIRKFNIPFIIHMRQQGFQVDVACKMDAPIPECDNDYSGGIPIVYPVLGNHQDYITYLEKHSRSRLNHRYRFMNMKSNKMRFTRGAWINIFGQTT